MNKSNGARLPRTILVAVDAEGLASHAIHAGIDLARKVGAKVELVHAAGSALPGWEQIEDARRASAKQGFVDTARQAMLRYVHQVLVDLGEDPSIDEDIVHVEAGLPAKVILDRAREMEADLILVGPHKKRGLVDFGSTARQVIAHASRSLWMQPGPVRPIESVLVPIDLSTDSLNALSHACELARVLKARVRAVHCFQSVYYVAAMWPEYPDFASAYAIDEVREASATEFEKAMASFDWRGVPHRAEFVDAEPVEKILELAHEADLVVMGTHGRSGLSSVVLGSVAYSVLKRSDKPVWAIRETGREFAS